MKKLNFILAGFCLLMFFSSAELKAQKDKDPLKGALDMVGKQAGMNDLMGQFLKGINNNAFTSGKSGKKDLLNKLSGIDATDYLQYASVAGDLAGALKGTSFLPDWASKKDGVLDQIKSAASIADVAGGVLDMSKMIDPGMFSKGFKKNMGTWTSALSLLSLVK